MFLIPDCLIVHAYFIWQINFYFFAFVCCRLQVSKYLKEFQELLKTITVEFRQILIEHD